MDERKKSKKIGNELPTSGLFLGAKGSDLLQLHAHFPENQGGGDAGRGDGVSAVYQELLGRRRHNGPAPVQRARGHVYADDPPLLALYQNRSLMVTINMQRLLRGLLTALPGLVLH